MTTSRYLTVPASLSAALIRFDKRLTPEAILKAAREAGGQPAELPRLAAELATQRCDAVVAVAPSAIAAKSKTYLIDQATFVGVHQWNLLETLDVRAEGRVCLDVGASTGGFTEVCLARVQRHRKLRSPFEAPSGCYVLMEAEATDAAAVEAYLKGLPEVREVHHLHIWSLGAGEIALTAHVVRHCDSGHDAFIAQTVDELGQRFAVGAQERAARRRQRIEIEAVQALWQAVFPPGR